jgi:hypothetical protein
MTNRSRFEVAIMFPDESRASTFHSKGLPGRIAALNSGVTGKLFWLEG